MGQNVKLLLNKSLLFVDCVVIVYNTIDKK